MGILDNLNKGVLLIAYVVFILAGGTTIGIGVYYMSQVPDSSSSVALALAGTGGAMMLVGGLAVFSLIKDMWPILTLVWFFDLALFIVMVVSCIVGVILGMDVRDPTRTAVDNAFTMPAYLTAKWDAGWCQTEGDYEGKDQCDMDSGFGKLALDKVQREENRARDANGLSDWDATIYSSRDIFANCSVAYTGCIPNPDQNGTECLARFLLDDETPDADEAFGDKCVACQHACREGFISFAKSSLEPGAIVLFGTFVFSAIAIAVDRWIAATKPEGGLGQKVGFAVNGLVAVLGLVMAIAVAIGYHKIVENCPASADCTNSAVYVVVMLGVLMLVMGVFGIVATKFGIGPCLSILSVIHAMIALALLVSAIFVAIVAGQMDTVNAQSEKQFPELLRTYEQPSMGGPNFCRAAVLDENDVPIPASELPDGGVYNMDPCVDLSGGTLGMLEASCIGTSTEVLTCTGTATAAAYPSPTLPHQDMPVVCDTNSTTDAWPEGPYGLAGPAGECPIGCDRTAKVCDLDASTDGSNACPAGCADLPERQAECTPNMLVTDEALCPTTTIGGSGCTWDPERYAADPEMCPDADSNRCPVYAPLSHEECRLKIKTEIESNLSHIGMFAGVIAVGLFFIMYFTWAHMVAMKEAGGGGATAEAWEGDE
jgi:hypothetical protein